MGITGSGLRGMRCGRCKVDLLNVFKLLGSLRVSIIYSMRRILG